MARRRIIAEIFVFFGTMQRYYIRNNDEYIYSVVLSRNKRHKRTIGTYITVAYYRTLYVHTKLF